MNHDLGRLEGQVELVIEGMRDFRLEVGQRFDRIEQTTTTRLNEYGRRLRALEYYRWLLAGGITVLAAVLGWKFL